MSKAKKTISLIICSNNYSDALLSLMRKLFSQQIDINEKIEFLLIESSFTDEEKSIIKKIFPHLSIHNSLQRGISYARNIGVMHSSGEYIYFLDDDVVVPEGWLQSLAEYVVKNKPKSVFFGEVLPVDDISLKRESWMKSILETTPWVLTCITKENYKEMLPYTANCGIKRDLFQKYGYFSTSFGSLEGPIPMRFGEDPEFFFRLVQEGVSFSFVKKLSVFHLVNKTRSSLRYIISRFFDHGRNLSLVSWYHSKQLSQPVFSIFKNFFENWGVGWQSHSRNYLLRKICFHILMTLGFFQMCLYTSMYRDFFIKNYGTQYKIK